jgi:hypothetical protein
MHNRKGEQNLAYIWYHSHGETHTRLVAVDQQLVRNSRDSKRPASAKVQGMHAGLCILSGNLGRVKRRKRQGKNKHNKKLT